MYFLHNIIYTLKYGVIGLLASILVLAPFFLAAHRLYIRNLHRSLRYLSLALYFGLIWQITGLPTIYICSFEPRVYLLPFIGIADDVKNSILNCLLFLPLGFSLPLLWKKYRKGCVCVFFGLFLSLFLELMQLFTLRLTDVNDLITNTLGTVLGFFLARPLFDKFPGAEKSLAFRILCVTAFTMFFLQPPVERLLQKILL